MTTYVARGDLQVGVEIARFVQDALRGTGLDEAGFWHGAADILREFGRRNAELLEVRDRLQQQIDGYHRARAGGTDYRAFLEDIGYLLPEPAPFAVTTQDVDPEIATMAGPQLVVPLLNARFALNAANARWGSLYDALYGTDAIPLDGEWAVGDDYNPARGAEVITRGRALLDEVVPLAGASHADVTSFAVDVEGLVAVVAGEVRRLVHADAFVGFTGSPDAPSRVLLKHNGLHLEIVIDRTGSIGRDDPAGVQDVVLESALTTIVDLEDSVAAVDSEDKALGYRNWRGLMDGTLTAEIEKGGRRFTRGLAPDRTYETLDGGTVTLVGRSLLFVRNVGHLMRTDAVLDHEGTEVFEGILDAIMTALGALPDLRGERAGANSRTGSVYIVKPKMHGPAEVRFAVDLFARVEQLLSLPPGTLKIGIMDEERRTSANLAGCIAEAADRVVFINTGFLDRTGDEIHTSLHAGPFPPKALIKTRPFLQTYEDRNVAIGLGAGMGGRGQIGKGMWAMPDLMADMLAQKIGHVESGASTAWVPSPTAATLHALHYHRVDAFARRADVMPADDASLARLLDIPVAPEGVLTPEVVAAELDNNVQSILGYVVRWIDQGIGCSKVPDIQGVALMEDRATLRISSQLLANWLLHGVVTPGDVEDSLFQLADVVDRQNAGDPAYQPLVTEMGPGLAFVAARRLILDGATQPNGYTEVILHDMRRKKKQMSAANAGERGASARV